MGAAALTQRGVTTAALGIVLNRNACPVVDGVAQSRMRSVGVKRPTANGNEGSTPALGARQARKLLEAPPADTLKGVRANSAPVFPSNNQRKISYLI